MSKIKKFIYPFIFSISFFILYIVMGIVLSFTLDNGGYAGAAIAILVVALWAWFVVPFYCVKYSKVIQNEKFKFLFATYNSLVLLIIHVIPFNFDSDTYIFAAIFFIWAEIWSVVSLVMRILHKKQDDEAAEERLCIENSLLQNEKKRILAICFTSFYMLTLVINSDFVELIFFQNFEHALPVISAALTLLFLFSKNKDYRLKKWLLPITFGIIFIENFGLTLFNLLSSRIIITNMVLFIAIKLLTCTAIVLMFIGTLRNFKYINLLKYGALAYAVISFVNFIDVIISVIRLSIPSFMQIFGLTLYYLGIFILATNKKSLKAEKI